MRKEKILISFIIVVACLFALTGCTNSEINDDDLNYNEEEKNGILENLTLSGEDVQNEDNNEELLKDNDEELIINNEDSENVLKEELTSMGLFSTENRAVFNFGDVYYLVYEFDGDKVLSEKNYYMYNDENIAKLACEEYKNTITKNSHIDSRKIKDVVQEGKYVVLIFEEASYENLTRADVMESYSYLEQI